MNMEENKLPVKTKIAAWWMILVGIMILGYSINLLFVFLPLVNESVAYCPDVSSAVNQDIENSLKTKIFSIFTLILIFTLFIFILAWYLFRAKKWAWIGLFILSLTPVFCLVGFLINPSSPGPVVMPLCTPSSLLLMELDERMPVFVISIASFFVPLILLLFDRRNFWKAAS